MKGVIKGRVKNVIDFLFVVISVLIIICVGLQHAKQGLSDSLSGESSELFKHQKERGFESVLSRCTYGLSMAFIVLGLLIYMK